jgi:hypothetical protein
MEAELGRMNDLHLWDFEVIRGGAESLLILGSNDFTYYHYLEAEFDGVTFCDLPDTFSHAQFRLGQQYGETWSIWVTAESHVTSATEFEIQAKALRIRIGKVYYDHRENLLPGERIAGRPGSDD